MISYVRLGSVCNKSGKVRLGYPQAQTADDRTDQRVAVVAHEHQHVDGRCVVGHADAALGRPALVRDDGRQRAGQQREARGAQAAVHGPPPAALRQAAHGRRARGQQQHLATQQPPLLIENPIPLTSVHTCTATECHINRLQTFQNKPIR